MKNNYKMTMYARFIGYIGHQLLLRTLVREPVFFYLRFCRQLI